MSTSNTLLLNGQPVQVTPENWQQIAKARLAQDSNLSPENRLGEYQAIQQMAGVQGNFNFTLDANGAAVANTKAYDALQSTYAVQGATAIESGESAVFGQDFVDTLHRDSAYVLDKGSELYDKAKQGASDLWDAAAEALKRLKGGLPDLNGLNNTLQLLLAAAAIGGVAFIVWKVKK